METWEDQAEGRKDEGACPSGVDQMKTTGLANGEVHNVTKLLGRTLHASTAGPPGCNSRPMLQGRFGIVQVGEVTIVDQNIDCRQEPQVAHPGQNETKRLKNYKGTEFLSMSRGVDRFYRCLAASIDFIDISRRR